MFRLLYTRTLNKNLQPLTSNSKLLSIYSLSMKSNDNENSNDETEKEKAVKNDITSLLTHMKDTSVTNQKPFQLFQNLMNNVKTKETDLSRKSRTQKKIKKLSKLKSKQGRDFLFKQIHEKLDVETEVSDNIAVQHEGVEIIPETTDVDTNVDIEVNVDAIHVDERHDIEVKSNTIDVDGGNIVVNVAEDIVVIDHPDKSSSQEMSMIEMEQLKEEIKQQADNRNVSKLMNALIDDASNPEEKLKNLMSAMTTSKMSTITKPYKDDRRRAKPKWERVDFNEGSTTNLFSDFKIDYTKHKEEKFSLHQQNWIKNLDSLLPENVPQNLFEVMMLDIDKQWKFPIDNEQDLGIEDETSFEEHVFLDHYLDEFPDKEPIQKFMELVITGLQQNPHLSVVEKKNRIIWFKDYFEKFPDEELSFQ